MNFNFDLRNIIKEEIIKVDKSLLPDGFQGDRTSYITCIQSITAILDEMGAASAKALGIREPITSAEKLRNSNQIVYLSTDSECVVGILKIGRKKLFVYDEVGKCYELFALCILDFYVDETRQRMGYGKRLFDYMLLNENIEPDKLAIDSPSESLLFFLRKHYGLVDAVQQNNNFVVFSGFFPKNKDPIIHKKYEMNSQTVSPYSDGSGATLNGRHTAYKRKTTMGQIIH